MSERYLLTYLLTYLLGKSEKWRHLKVVRIMFFPNTRSYISYPRGITVTPGDTIASKNDSLSQGTFSFRHFSSFNFVLTLSIKLNADDALRVISIKFLFVISMLCKAEWSWELQTWSHNMYLLDISSTSPHYFYRKWIGATNENSNVHLGVLKG